MMFKIRRPRIDEHDRIHRLVSAIVNETYGGIWPTTPIQVEEEDWSVGWVAAASDDLVGWRLTTECWLEDLWVPHRSWGQGVGSALLAHAEQEIAARGIATARLSVIASISGRSPSTSGADGSGCVRSRMSFCQFHDWK